MSVGAPQQSTKSFVSPVGVPIKKTPPIADIIEDRVKKDFDIPSKKRIESKELIDTQVIPVSEDVNGQISEDSEIVGNLATAEFVENQDNFEKHEGTLIVKQEISEEDFATHWATLFDLIFSHTPTIYYPLKGYVPQIKGNIIYIDLKNEIQKEHFDPKIREILAYLRTHFNEAIEEILINVDESIVTKKIIYDTVDKMKNLNEQNSNFEEFSSILDLKVKE